jgi:hypothetical protein
VISNTTRAVLAEVAKALWYPDRVYPALVRNARGRCGDEELEAFAEWWPAGQVSRKREDALAMLRRMRDDAAGGTWPRAPQFWFERTVF